MSKSINTIHSDAIWRQTIKFENNTASQWEQNWGFIKQAMIENQIAAKQQQLLKQQQRNQKQSSKTLVKLTLIVKQKNQCGLPSKLAPGLSDENNPIVTDWLFSGNRDAIIQYR